MTRFKQDNLSKEHVKSLNCSIRQLKIPIKMAIPKLPLLPFYVVGYADGCFANDEDLTSLLELILFLKDKYNNALIIYYNL